MSLVGEDVAGFLAARGIVSPITIRGRADSVRIITEGEVPPMPDRLVVLSFTGGPGERGQRTRDELTINVRCRGLQGVDSDSHALAWRVDEAMLGAVAPLSMGAVRVISLARYGGPPLFVERDDADRVHHVCNYLVHVARTLH